MTKKQFLQGWVNGLTKKDDKPFNRQLFNDMKDMLHKDGLITDNQVNNWNYPQNKLYK